MSASRLGLLAHSLPSTRPAMCKYPEIIISLACTLVDVTSSVAYRCSGSMFAETFQIVSVCKYSPQPCSAHSLRRRRNHKAHIKGAYNAGDCFHITIDVFDDCRVALLPRIAFTSLFCVQVVLPVWSGDHVKSLQHVRQLHTVPGGHHRRHPEAGYAALVQGVRAVPAATQALGQSCPGIEGAAHAVHQAPQRPNKGTIQHLACHSKFLHGQGRTWTGPELCSGVLIITAMCCVTYVGLHSAQMSLHQCVARSQNRERSCFLVLRWHAQTVKHS